MLSMKLRSCGGISGHVSGCTPQKYACAAFCAVALSATSGDAAAVAKAQRAVADAEAMKHELERGAARQRAGEEAEGAPGSWSLRGEGETYVCSFATHLGTFRLRSRTVCGLRRR